MLLSSYTREPFVLVLNEVDECRFNWRCAPIESSEPCRSTMGTMGTMLTYHLEYSDYINPIDLCNRLNSYIVPEAAVHAFLTFLFIINGYWLTIVLNLPLLAFNAKKCVYSCFWNCAIELLTDCI